ncbi:MAG: hypothetical protein U9O87_01500 [Verrucomicrobiota bacterium]|nr:hypothetical protein [Verrucomicrobiota bacterium]
MLEVKSVDDLQSLSKPLMEWLKHENPYLEEEDWEPGSGYLIVLDINDKVDNLTLGVKAINDLSDIECWEWVSWNKQLEFFCCCVILGNDFGLVFAIPEASIMGNQNLYKKLHSALLV